MFDSIWWYIMPVLFGGGFYWIAGRCRGRNARSAFRFAAWGSWLLLLLAFDISLIPIPFLGTLLTKIVLAAPSVICYILAVSSILKEVRAQQRGEYTDAA